MWVIYWGDITNGISLFEQTADLALEVLNPDNNNVKKFESINLAQRYLGKHYGDCTMGDIIHIGLARKIYKQWKH
jgi:hypothetical protein